MKKYDGELIFSEKNRFGEVEVVDSDELRMLHFGTPVIQSSMYLHDPFALEMEYNRVMLLSLLFNPALERALFLGLGGASKAKFLWKYFPRCQVDAVEYNPAVVDVCYRYFGLPHDPRLTIYTEDALHFLNHRNPSAYDFLFIDLCLESGMSTKVGEFHFFKNCYDLLARGGILVWNLWRTSPKELIDLSVGSLSQHFGKNFLFLSVEESLNYVVYAFKPPIPELTLEEALHRVEGLTRTTGTDFETLFAIQNYFKPNLPLNHA